MYFVMICMKQPWPNIRYSVIFIDGLRKIMNTLSRWPISGSKFGCLRNERLPIDHDVRSKLVEERINKTNYCSEVI